MPSCSRTPQEKAQKLVKKYVRSNYHNVKASCIVIPKLEWIYSSPYGEESYIQLQESYRQRQTLYQDSESVYYNFMDTFSSIGDEIRSKNQTVQELQNEIDYINGKSILRGVGSLLGIGKGLIGTAIDVMGDFDEIDELAAQQEQLKSQIVFNENFGTHVINSIVKALEQMNQNKDYLDDAKKDILCYLNTYSPKRIGAGFTISFPYEFETESLDILFDDKFTKVVSAREISNRPSSFLGDSLRSVFPFHGIDSKILTKDRVLEVYWALPDHARVSSFADDKLSKDFLYTLRNAWDVPSLDYFGAGDNEFLLYLLSGNGGDAELRNIEVHSVSQSDESHAKAKIYNPSLDTEAEITLNLIFEDEKWVLDDILPPKIEESGTSIKKQCSEYIHKTIAKYKSGELSRFIRDNINDDIFAGLYEEYINSLFDMYISQYEN